MTVHSAVCVCACVCACVCVCVCVGVCVCACECACGVSIACDTTQCKMVYITTHCHGNLLARHKPLRIYSEGGCI